MKLKHALLSIFTIALIWSCGKDDSPTTPPVTEEENSVPVIAAKTFTVAETIADTEVIGTVTATDADEDDTLTFSIATNSDTLFEITATGDLSLASGKTLDAATKEQHSITVKVDDGEDTASATITIKVTSEEVPETNEAPEMADQEFMAAEDITEANEIGQVVATDADDDTLTFELTANDNDLFMLSESGILTLADGKSLDYETATSHSITVSVTDGEETVDATITITVQNVIENMAEDPASFVTTWKTETDGEEMEIYFSDLYEYNFTIDWGDGAIENVSELPVDQKIAHVYQMAGTFTIAIKGEMPYFTWKVAIASKLQSIEQWGAIKWQDLSNSFNDCVNMICNAKDAPDLSNVSDLSYMFDGATSFTGDLSKWNTGTITNTSYMFRNATSFNSDLSEWNVSNVSTMSNMFQGAVAFNSDISQWNTGKVTGTIQMFKGATNFNQDIGNWDIKNVVVANEMFDNSGMSALNFSNTLIGWASQEVQPNVSLGAAGVNICEDGDGFTAYLGLTSDPNNWTITFGGSEVCN